MTGLEAAPDTAPDAGSKAFETFNVVRWLAAVIQVVFVEIHQILRVVPLRVTQVFDVGVAALVGDSFWRTSFGTI